jgi:arylsulfatase A-like enzyme
MSCYTRYLFATLFVVFTFVTLSPHTNAATRPNVVFIVSEDNSIHYLDMFFKGGAETPNIEKLAEHGLKFTHAFSNSPVCSVARSTLATSVYAPRLGTQYHRRTKLATLPKGWKLFQQYLADAGYYTTNRSKTDYNAQTGKKAWHSSSKKASWKNRPNKDTPFFHMESHAQSHEGRLHFSGAQMKAGGLTTDPKTVTVAPYHPNTKTFQYTYAKYHDCIKTIDNIVGNTVASLKEAGQLENTFIFYFGDHGGVLPRGKGYVYESGLHVPLVVRIPKNFKHLVDANAGDKVTGFVSFIDFGPTVLNLAGISTPKHMDGKPFLGKGIKTADVSKRDEAFGYADRFDEKYDLIRTLRKGKYKYHRNYHPFYADGLQNNYRYRMLAYKEWRTLFNAGKLNKAQSAFFQPRQPESLYDVEADPHEINNLANNPKLNDVLLDMRSRLSEKVKSINDLSMYPESVMVDQALGDGPAYGNARASEIARLNDIADLALLPFDQAHPKLIAAMKSRSDLDKQWAMTVCTAFGKKAKPFANAARELLKSKDQLVRLRAIEFLATIGEQEPQPVIMDILKQSNSYLVASITLNSVVYLRDSALGYKFNITKKDIAAKGNSVDRRLEYLNAK